MKIARRTSPEAAHLNCLAPRGETPTQFIGMPGWRPSGRGAPLLSAGIVDGRPQGLWWRQQITIHDIRALTVLYLPDGMVIHRPVLGGGALFDFQAQQSPSNARSIRRFEIASGAMAEFGAGSIQPYPAGPFSFGSTDGYEWFDAGVTRSFAMRPPDSLEMVGSWGGGPGVFVFGADGSYHAPIAFAGRWCVDDHLLVLQPASGPYGLQIGFIGATGKNLLVINDWPYVRK